MGVFVFYVVICSQPQFSSEPLTHNNRGIPMQSILMMSLLAFFLALSTNESLAETGRSHNSSRHRSSSSSYRSAYSGIGSNSSSHSVRGYVTKRGTYVRPHRNTNPDRTNLNNYGTKGNYNPYTGKTGTRKP